VGVPYIRDNLVLIYTLGNAVNIAIWSTIEPGAGIIAGCLATLRPFVKRFVATARSVRSSATSSAKAISRFSRSNENSSNPKGTIENNAQRKLPAGSSQGANQGPSSSNDQDIELKSDANKRYESTDCILEQTGDIEEPWSSQQGGGLEIDRRSSQAPRIVRTTWTTRSRGTSIALSLDRPLPPIPPAFLKHDEG